VLHRMDEYFTEAFNLILVRLDELIAVLERIAVALEKAVKESS